ncbi:MAG: exo-alpha-sialidase [Pirellulales bacterium]
MSVRRIWDAAPHNAFTDLTRFDDRWFCAFREGKAHVSPDGALRVLTSANGEKWTSTALIKSTTGDLRDAKLTITPDKRLMLTAAKAFPEGESKSHQSLAWFSEDGKQWGEPAEIGDRDYWLWRTTWHKGTAHSIGYGCRKDNQWVRLYKSADGRQFDVIKDKLHDEGYPNETSLVFLPDDRCFCLLRRDGQPNTGLLGIAAPPYTDWQWKDLNKRIGGPHMIRLPAGRIVAAVRLMDAQVRTSLCWLNPEAGTLSEFLKLPSGGDTSYAGLVWHDEMLWVSYYSSHEGKTSIYLAKVRFE